MAIIVGPTAVGKSRIAVELAAKINAEVISGDSMQIYKGMDIGTAKISAREQFASNGCFIPHHMIDILEPDQAFSVADYQSLVRELIKSIHKRNKNPLIVGGTGLYIQSIIDNYVFLPQQGNPLIRNKLQQQMRDKGNLFFYEELKKAYPKAAEVIHPNDAKRIIRTLETFYISGQRLTDNWHLKSSKGQSEYNPLFIIGLTMDREELYKRINARVDQMMAEGLIEEVYKLQAKGYCEQYKSMHSIGYREINSYFNGKCSLQEAISQIKRASRQFAKRQLTWFSKDKRIRWFNVLNYRNVHEIAGEIAESLGGQHSAV